ncbi:MAG: leucine-rich repeat domain-containing protein [Bacteroidetes bacterium]|jgi:Leucine-rich repeat (LRR) protein|nr:leucine-rich repeat domain-containing protein [Bacteroidota bacterium]
MTQLTSLAVNNNQLTTLPSGVSQLVNLTYLSTYNNALTSYPSVADLVNIQSLYIGSNKLTAFPTGMQNLTKLTSLEIHGNQFEVFPTFVYDLPALERVWLNENLRTKKGFHPIREKPILHFR